MGQFCKLRLESNTVAYITREANIGDKLCVRVERLAAATKTGILGPWPVLVGVKIGISRLGLPRLGRGGRGASD